MSRSTTPTVMETQDPEPMDVQASPEMEQTDQTAEPSDTKSKPKRPRAPETLTREPGKSLLPHSRVQKILKADKELIMVQREAAFLIARATEEFVARLSEAAQRVAARERRTTVQGKDLVTSVRRAEEFAFLEELLPWLEPDQPPATRRGAEKEGKARGGTSGKKAGQNPTMLDQFVAQRTKEDSPGEAGEDDEFGDGVDGELIDHADGTMSLGAPTEAPP